MDQNEPDNLNLESHVDELSGHENYNISLELSDQSDHVADTSFQTALGDHDDPSQANEDYDNNTQVLGGENDENEMKNAENGSLSHLNITSQPENTDISSNKTPTSLNSNEQSTTLSNALSEGTSKRPKRTNIPENWNIEAYKSSTHKPPRSGYVYFLTVKRREVALRYPNLSLPEITRMIASMWKNASEKEYNEEATRLKKKFRKEFPNLPEQTPRRRRGRVPKAASLDDASGQSPKLPTTSTQEKTPTTASKEKVAFEAITEDDLYCSLCNQYFSSLHNKREHLNGRKHREIMQEYGELDVQMKVFTDDFVQFHRVRERQLKEMIRETQETENSNLQLLNELNELTRNIQPLQLETERIKAVNEVYSGHVQHIQQMISKAFSDDDPWNMKQICTARDTTAIVAVLHSLIHKLEDPHTPIADKEAMIRSLRSVNELEQVQMNNLEEDSKQAHNN
eukprot:gene10924-2998_t